MWYFPQNKTYQSEFSKLLNSSGTRLKELIMFAWTRVNVIVRASNNLQLPVASFCHSLANFFHSLQFIYTCFIGNIVYLL